MHSRVTGPSDFGAVRSTILMTSVCTVRMEERSRATNLAPRPLGTPADQRPLGSAGAKPGRPLGLV